MGLIKAAFGAAGGVLADQWKEYYYCDSISEDVLMVKGQKRTGKRSSNTKGSDNVITNGSIIAVADGQAMIIVENGRIIEVCAEPGEFTYDTSAEPSIFSGSLGESIKASFKTFGRRFTFGGDVGRDQRVYYFNTKEIMGNKYGTPAPVPFRVVARDLGDALVRIRYGDPSVTRSHHIGCLHVDTQFLQFGINRLGGIHTAPAGGLQQPVKDLLLLIHDNGLCTG